MQIEINLRNVLDGENKALIDFFFQIIIKVVTN